ncbi:fatty acid desaturase [Pendulispora brunnea]|uniref:Fatty acid desaturase n=1 Tax=Pendulispora brunnea TaxID=2905690 RepID=A0ABZ2KIN3_9BACT
MLRRFKRDRYMLTKYYAASTLVFVAAIGVARYVRHTSYEPSPWVWVACLVPLIISNFSAVVVSNLLCVGLMLEYHRAELSAWHLALLPLGIYAGMVNVPVIHNCAHGSFRPVWLNRILGELCAVHLLSGYPGFVILHLLHHQYADDPDLDPHPNLDKTFWQYLNGLKGSLARAFRRNYFGLWGVSAATRCAWRAVRLLLPVNRVLKALFVLAILGPIPFTIFYIPSFIANQLTYAHINYYTHARRADGRVEIVNLNHTAVYRFLNAVLLGIYFHKNHHRRPLEFNPQNAAPPKAA